MTRVAVNPPPAMIGAANVVFGGTARNHYVPPMPGAASIKAVVRGRAAWESEGRRFVVTEGTCLLLDEGQEYSLTIEEPEPVTTFCLFFRNGFLGDALRSAAVTDAALLDEPFESGSERPVPGLRHLSDAMHALLSGMQQTPTEDDFIAAASLIASDLHREQRSERTLDAAKSGTRHELRRRVQRGVDFMLSHLADPITVEDAARAACLSLFHFHRAFTALHGTTPHRFLREQRLALAARLLRLTEDDVTDIAARSGFESLGSFTTRFTKSFGLPPGRYRQVDTAAPRT
ncbi:MAG TPA: AraC family transcriptional regulator [Thermoanaerobaculia bacterium]|nr:AraC family transcriptional regulator [Thermoanaerobaculia bacterium]